MFKLVSIKEELVWLTGNEKSAVVLGVLMEYSARESRKWADEIDLFGLTGDPWFFKNIEDISIDSLMKLSKKKTKKILRALTEHGWIEMRKQKGSATTEIRVRMTKILIDLIESDFYEFHEEFPS